jgi:glycosyltransferase involved in cell wall biosynthesis
MPGASSGCWCDASKLKVNAVEDALVSCICVTRNRVALLKRAVHSFQYQTYSPCELIIQYEADDLATRTYLSTLVDPRIVPMEVQAMPRLSLGSRRNIAVRDARGKYIAQWDDDDWSAPSRLAEQVAAIRTSGRQGCVLLRCVLFDGALQRAWVSASRFWEFSLVAERSAVPAFPELEKGEDTPVILRMLNAYQLAGIDRPDLYVYVYHGANTWDREHWENAIAKDAQALPLSESQAIALQLQAGL